MTLVVDNTGEQPRVTTLEATQTEPSKTQQTGFFDRAPMQLTMQQHFIACLRQQQSTIVTLSAEYPLLSFYSLPALALPGLSVVICIDDYWVARNAQALYRAGYAFPEVAALHRRLSVDEEDHILKAINHYKVKLLFLTPEKFAALPVYQQLIHQKLSFLGIEDAQHLLPTFSNHARYEALLKTLTERPLPAPLALFTLPLNETRIKELSRRFPVSPPFEVLHLPLTLNHKQLQVQRFANETQVLKALVRELVGALDDGSYHQLTHPGKVFIQVNRARTQQRIAATLHQSGVSPVVIYHDALSADERLSIEQAFYKQPHIVVVSTSPHYRLLPLNPKADDPLPTPKPTDMWDDEDVVEDQPVRLLFGELPSSVDELVTLFYQKTARPLEAIVFYSKTDDDHIRQKWEYAQQSGDLSNRQQANIRLHQLSTLRAWVFAKTCRLNSLAEYLQGDPMRALLDTTVEKHSSKGNPKEGCGFCDYCHSNGWGGSLVSSLGHSFAGSLPQWLRRWV